MDSTDTEEETTSETNHGDVFVKGSLQATTTDQIYAERCRRVVSTQAFCTSHGCFSRYRVLMEEQDVLVSKFMEGVPKEVSKGATDCPDCEHALLWRSKYEMKQYYS